MQSLGGADVGSDCGLVGFCCCVCVGGWMDGWVDGWMGGWMDGWMDGCSLFPLLGVHNKCYE